MNVAKFMRGLFQRKMVVLLVAIVLLFAVLYNAGMFGGTDKRVRITCVGDSITYGSGVLKTREIDCYPAQLQTMLGTTYLVSNFGLRNATASATGDLPYMQSQEYKDSLESKPDIVVLMLGTNDAKTYNWNPKEYEKGLQELVESYKALSSKPTVYLMRSPYCYAINENGEAEYSIQADVVTGELGDIVTKVAGETGVEVIDLFAVTEGQDDLYTDGIHFNADGYSLIADTVYEYVK
ncbi:GDSL-type esterase/lipase family protein [Pseudobutyrivibrio xylanivorans]|uniref:SGNH hydrolase-type esterase domain-containing protein n=1 Tax=Pseudobutyrivibrio xylanivorans TaxID=185007 RepID=A0A5P6VR61_PSEXY|nr:GDSL-type esterase/lipase family protein [Pseudobutyrivibrio xylanivorans]QFJ53654.1 hypothetical protein FXF36_01630 [Pseudobutyrivibrio xylanivorans]